MKMKLLVLAALASIVVATEEAEKESTHSILDGFFSPQTIENAPLIVVLKEEYSFSQTKPQSKKRTPITSEEYRKV